MRDGWKSRWGWRVSAVVLVGGLLVLGTGTVVTQAGDRDDDHNKRNPFDQILHKLDKILDAIKGGGGQEGNHTLRWDTVQPAATRFVVLTAFASAAVLDNETGLVWEKVPATTLAGSWWAARDTCAEKAVGGRKGWRLPSVVELSSLVDPANVNPALPTGSPFTIPPSALYWSATTVTGFDPGATDVTHAWDVDFSIGFVGGDMKNFGGAQQIWCVRGGMNADQY